MYLLWKTSEENGLLGQSILGITGTAKPSLFAIYLRTYTSNQTLLRAIILLRVRRRLRLV